MNDKLNITIRIANQAPIPLVINRQDEEVIRMAEYNVNRLWTSWSTKFKSKSQMEVLSMVAFRFAELFFTQGQAVKARRCLEDSRRVSTRFCSMLIRTPGNNDIST